MLTILQLAVCGWNWFLSSSIKAFVTVPSLHVSVLSCCADDPEFLATQAQVRQSLLKTLSRAIKEVQLLFTELGEGGKVGDCRITQRLCTRFENALRHGQKTRWFGQNASFWPLVLKISRKQAIEYINR